MGLYDRQYSREPEIGFRVARPQSMTVIVVIVTVLVYLAQLASPRVTDLFSLRADWYRQPWQAYQLLTYGFLHSTTDIQHILFNMLVFWVFGRDLEDRLGRSEFLAFYLTAIVFAGAFWSLSEASFGAHASLLGASGGITGLFALYALLYPHRQILLFFVIPMPVWVAALIGIGMDVRGALARSGNIACVAHLAGAVFGLYYYKLNWHLAPLYGRVTGLFTGSFRGPRPKLRVHEPDSGAEQEDEFARQVDAILEKIQEQGQDSLTPAERKLLERASRRYQQKRK